MKICDVIPGLLVGCGSGSSITLYLVAIVMIKNDRLTAYSVCTDASDQRLHLLFLDAELSDRTVMLREICT